MLRAGSGDHAYSMKFGPHGGGHGHYDKLGFVSFFEGGILAVDPGTQPYAAPTHQTWDLTTVAHNTMVVDEKRQNAATGELLWFQTGEGFAAAAASAGAAYPQVQLTRTLMVTPEYTLDLAEAQAIDGAVYVIDWVYHNAGAVQTALPLGEWSGFGNANGYQHLTGNRSARTSEAWQVRFDGTPSSLPNAGSTYASNSSVKAAFQISREQAFQGRYSARASYEFSGASGYALYTVNIPNAPTGKPRGLRLQILGDGSGHKLSLRLTDASDERFVASVGPVDWNGWREVEVTGPENWIHFLGNNDGVFDSPARAAILQLDYTAGGAQSGSLYLDEPHLLMEHGEIRIQGFEIPERHLSLWMTGGAETDVVTGMGLGPDLRVPIPYVLARRQATKARFAALLEPHVEAPLITGFREDSEGCFAVTGPYWTDHVCFKGSGVAYRRE